MRERPIIFTGPSVRAILAGHKTMTRRVIPPKVVDLSRYGPHASAESALRDQRQFLLSRCPYAGTRLWVKETWQHNPFGGVVYREGSGIVDCGGRGWRPSIYMPRWASRLTLEVTEVRVQRLASISEEDARAEGVTDDYPEIECNSARPYREGFAYLWDSINGKRAPWASNPFVWCVSFRRIDD